jgi:hypothetical protein
MASVFVLAFYQGKWTMSPLAVAAALLFITAGLAHSIRELMSAQAACDRLLYLDLWSPEN